MDKLTLKRSTRMRLFCTGMLVLLSLTTLDVWAQQAMGGCEMATLEANFKNGLRSVEQTPVLKIQRRLKALDFNPVKVDGIMGPLTREALQAFCRAQAEQPSARGIAATLIRLLFLETEEDTAAKNAGAAQDLAGPTVYYRWMAPEQGDQAQAASTPAPTAAGNESNQSAQPACQGAADQTAQSSSSPTDATAAPAESAAKTSAGSAQGEPASSTPADGAAGGESVNTAEGPAAAEEKPPARGTETGQTATPAATPGERPASSSTSGEDANATVETNTTTTESATTAPADGAAASAESETHPTAETTKSQPAVSQAPAVQSSTGTTQQATPGCQAQPAQPTAQPQQALALPDKLVERLKPIEGIAYPTQGLFEQAVQVLLQDDMAEYVKYKDKILAQARQGPIEDFATIQVAAADCGCSRGFPNLVYGFYPFWMAQSDPSKEQDKGRAPPQQIDFSLFERIGFYALSLNEQGEILNPLQWSNSENIAQFIDQAHQYKVAVDLTVYATAWQGWSAKVMDKASSEVARLATEKFSVTQTDSLLQRITVSLQGFNARADGVTLVFDDYGRHAEKAGNIVAFVGKLAQKLKDLDLDMKINILLGIDAKDLLLERKTSLFGNLEDILLHDITSSATVDYLLVYLPEPTSTSKKALRRQVEDEFHGAERQEVLRKIVAVISPDGHDQDERGPFSQFKDDLIYFQDNFKGVGLWPLPLESDKGMKNIRYNLIDLYSDTEHVDALRAIVDYVSPQICQFACPNRWLVRVVFDLLLGLVVIYAVLSIWFCRLKELYKKYFLNFLILPLAILLLILISLACDPFWGQKRDLVIGLLILILLAVVMIKSIGKMLRPPLP